MRPAVFCAPVCSTGWGRNHVDPPAAAPTPVVRCTTDDERAEGADEGAAAVRTTSRTSVSMVLGHHHLSAPRPMVAPPSSGCFKALRASLALPAAPLALATTGMNLNSAVYSTSLALLGSRLER